MAKYFFYLFFFVAFLSTTGYGQDLGVPFIKNYSPEEYNGEPQNWQICQGKDGLIYSANNSGLLEFDGVNWKLIEVPKKTTRSVALSKDGKIYVGTSGDIGYIDYNIKGKQVFISLLHKIPNEFRDFVEVWKTAATSDGVYFKTNKYVFLWDGEKITTWRAPEYFAFSFVIGNDFYVKEDSLGLICFRNKQLVKLPSSDFFKEKEIRSIVEFDSLSLLVSTLQHGMYIYSRDGKVMPFKTGADDFINKNLLFAGCRINKQSIVFGTFRGGLILMSNKGKVLKVVDEDSGLRENSIRVTFLDREGGLWVGLNNGISRVEVNSPLTVLNKQMNIKGSVYQINRHGKTLYIGTAVGLNYIEPKRKEIRAIENFGDQVWNLYSLQDEQLLGTNNSSYVLHDLKLSLINNSGGSATFLQSKKSNNRVFVGMRDGLQSLYKTNKGWKVENQYKDIKGQIKSMVEDNTGRLWVQSNQQGIVRLDFSRSYSKPVFHFFSDMEGILKSDRYKLIYLNYEVSIFSNHQFYKYDSLKKKFTESPIYILGESAEGTELNNLTKGENGNLLAWSHSTVGYLKKKDNTEYLWDESRFFRIRGKAINFVYPDGDSLVWIGSANGLYRIDLTKENKFFEGFETQVRSVSQIDSDSVLYFGMPGERTAQLSYQFNKLRFHFAASFFDQSDETEYQTFLEGSDTGWSTWSTSSKKDYTNLWEGSYTFHVRSRNIYHTLGEEAQYSFVILPPWFRTKPAFAFYIICFSGLFYLGVRAYYNNLKRANKRLEMLVQMRTSRINSQKEEIESQRDNLVQAHQTIETQNNELLRMNHELEKIVEERTSALTKSNQELIEVNKELDRFVYRAAHDLRGPVATLLGLCNLSLMETRDESAVRYLSKIQFTAERLNFLLFMLLKLNRIKTTEVVTERIDIDSLVKRISISVKMNYKERPDIKIFTKIDPQIAMHSDKTLISIILENLIDNAFKFARPDLDSKIDIEIKKNGDRVNILVSDNGIGIDKEY
ncbi:MAG: hypothetical protein HYR67_03095 [Bacteroidetes bacterium]|nr:hypothetical protein [Bacteroidota bacterium]